MRRCAAGLFAAVLALVGCRSTTDPKPNDRDPRGLSTGRNKDNGKDSGKDAKGPTWIDPLAKLPGTNTSVPKGGSWGDPKNPNFDARAEAQDGVGGKVVDVYNRPAKNIFIRVEAVSDAPGAAAKGIYTDGNGYFFTRGLKPGTTYNLTAEAAQEGKQLLGTVQTRVPNPVLTIILRDDLGSSAPAGGSGNAVNPKPPIEGFPPPPVPSDNDYLPPMGTTGQPSRPTNDGAFSPGTGATKPVPANIGGPPSRPSPSGPIQGSPLPEPNADDLMIPSKPLRPENVAGDGKLTPFTPPAANIPGPPVPRLPGPTPGQPQGQRGKSFRLLDSLERNWDFASDKAGSVVLVEFVTTICPNCKPVIPVLKDFQSRYGSSGLQVIAVLCDETPLKQRAASAAKYAHDNGTNYPVFVEPGSEPGAVRDAFGVESYPRAVLLDANGNVLWNGHPGKKQELESAIRKALSK